MRHNATPYLYELLSPTTSELMALKANAPEKQICKHFGCGQILTLQEQRFGHHCIIHNMDQETIYKKVISH